MDAFMAGVYLGEVSAQCRFGLGAVSQLNWALSVIFEPPTGSGEEAARRRFAQSEVFRALHSLLTHASNISKLLWPATGRGVASAARAARADDLRTRLHLSADPHPLKSRKLRDHLEHFDERLDEWRDSSAHHNFAQDSIGPAGSIVGIDPNDVMRWYDPTTHAYRFRNETFDIQEIVTAVEALLPVAEAAWQETVRPRKTHG